jgi:hypothetical protein
MSGSTTKLVLGVVLAAIVAEIVVRNYNLLRPHYTPDEVSTADCQLVGAEELAGSEDLVRGRYATLFITSGDLGTTFKYGNSSDFASYFSTQDVVKLILLTTPYLYLSSSFAWAI